MDEIFDKNTKIIFDTSVWLDMYRNLPDTIKSITNALNKEDFSSKIYIPNFVIKEFDKHKHEIQVEHKSIIKNVEESLSKAISEGRKAIVDAIQFQKKRYKIENDYKEKMIMNSLSKLEKYSKNFIPTKNTKENENTYLEIEKLFNKIRINNSLNDLTKDQVLDGIIIKGY